MRIHLRADSTNKEHTRFTVFMDGKNCGTLCMGPKDAREFASLVQDGCFEQPHIPAFEQTGNWYGDILEK